MKIGICATHLEDFQLSQDLPYIGVDHGVEELLKQNIQPIFTIGDFDSLKDRESLKDLDLKILPTRKDVTDTHAAIEYAIESGYDEIELYGVTGGRLDHFFAVMCLLEKYNYIDIKIIDKQNTICLLRPGTHKIYSDGYKFISFFALDESVITIKNAKYLLKEYLLKRDDPLCVSNEIDGDYAIVENTHDIFLMKSSDMN